MDRELPIVAQIGCEFASVEYNIGWSFSPWKITSFPSSDICGDSLTLSYNIDDSDSVLFECEEDIAIDLAYYPFEHNSGYDNVALGNTAINIRPNDTFSEKTTVTGLFSLNLPVGVNITICINMNTLPLGVNNVHLL